MPPFFSRARPLNYESWWMTRSVDCDSPFPLMKMMMARALSDDLRVRVLEVGAVGGSTRLVTKRFEIGISTAIRWPQRERESGEREARLQGEQSVGIGRSMLSRWLRQRGWTFKKRPHMHWSRSAQMCLHNGRTGATASLTSIRTAWSSSTKPASPRRWRAYVVVLYAENAVGLAFLMAIGKHHFYC